MYLSTVRLRYRFRSTSGTCRRTRSASPSWAASATWATFPIRAARPAPTELAGEPRVGVEPEQGQVLGEERVLREHVLDAHPPPAQLDVADVRESLVVHPLAGPSKFAGEGHSESLLDLPFEPPVPVLGRRGHRDRGPSKVPGHPRRVENPRRHRPSIDPCTTNPQEPVGP